MTSLLEQFMREARYGKPQRGGSFNVIEIQQVWEKARIIPSAAPDLYRLDSAGAMIYRWGYGDLGTYGWEIDHIYPVAHGGTDNPDNLQPLHWRNNRAKGDTLFLWTPAVTWAIQLSKQD